MSEYIVRKCAVVYDAAEVPVFHGTSVIIEGKVRKLLGGKELAGAKLKYEVRLDGEKVEELLKLAAATIQGRVGNIRDLPEAEFLEKARILNEEGIDLRDIEAFIEKGGKKGRPAYLVTWLVSTGAFNLEQAQAIYNDPTKRPIAQAEHDRITKGVSLAGLV